MAEFRSHLLHWKIGTQKMDQHRAERVSEALREELGEMISYELFDPRIGEAVVTEVLISPDKKHAQVRLHMDKDIAAQKGTKTEKSKLVGQAIARKAKELGIEGVIFDRGGNLYHGRVKAVADGAREGGLKF